MNQIDPDDDLLFDDEDHEEDGILGLKPWKVAIIDDDEQIHIVTKMALEDFTFADRPLEFLCAYSAQEAKQLFIQHPDIAVTLLDVVMEEDHAGLDFVDYIRKDLGNSHVRIVLRTGQPGQAPERQVIRDYDINDYKEKTELTARKLYTLMFSCLRSYRDILALEQNRRGLENVIAASQDVFKEGSLEIFAKGVIQQITSLLYAEEDAFVGTLEGLVTHEGENGIRFYAGTGTFENQRPTQLRDLLNDDWEKQLVYKDKPVGSTFTENYYLAQLKSPENYRSILYIRGHIPNDPMIRRFLDLFCQNALIAFDNLHLRNEVEETQQELVFRLGEAVETRSKETGNHVKRVAEISRFLALKSGMPQRWADTLSSASPMHDLGKIAIPDAILNKPGRLTEEEMAVMRGHASIGYDLLASSERNILRIGALIALEHHEKWDGSGYPKGIAGEDISLEGRITAIADVFDALYSDRCYKKAWPLEEILSYLQNQKGQHFDPSLVELLLDNLDHILDIQQRFKD